MRLLGRGTRLGVAIPQPARPRPSGENSVGGTVNVGASLRVRHSDEVAAADESLGAALCWRDTRRARPAALMRPRCSRPQASASPFLLRPR